MNAHTLTMEQITGKAAPMVSSSVSICTPTPLVNVCYNINVGAPDTVSIGMAWPSSSLINGSITVPADAMVNDLINDQRLTFQ